MKLWILEKAVDKCVKDPWDPWYDKAFGFIVAAPDEATARQIAQDNGGDERWEWLNEDWENLERGSVPAWTDPRYSTCKELKPEDYKESEMVLRDFSAA